MDVQGNTVLVVVDFQGGPLPPTATEGLDAASRERALQRDRASAMIASCRHRGVPVVWIQEVHKPHLVDIGRELDGSEGPHCIEGDPGTDLVEGLVPRADEFFIPKRRYSSFFGTELDIVLRAYRAETVLLIGGFTDICILYTAVDAHQRDLVVRVAVDVVSGSSVQAHDDALEMIRYLQRDALVTSDEVAAWLAAKTPEPA